MKIEKELVQLKPLQLQPASSGGTVTILESRRSYTLSPLQFSYLEVLKNSGSLENLVSFFLGQGWLVSFRELFALVHFLVQEDILTNASFKKYFLNNFDLSEIATSSATVSVSASQLPFFRSLEPSLAAYLLQDSQRLKVEAQTRLTESGKKDRDLYILLSGQAAIYRVFNSQQRQLMATLGPGALFGEKGFLLAQPRTADVIVTHKSEVLRVPHKAEFDALIKSDKAQSLQHRFMVLQALSSSDIFKNLPSDSLDSLIFSGRLCKTTPHQVLFQEGQVGNTCYLLLQGSVLISQGGKNINALQQGACFGEISLLMSGGRRTASAIAQQESILLEIHQNDFYRVLSQNLILAKEIESLAAARLQKDTQRR